MAKPTHDPEIWIRTKEANYILNIGICDRSFINKFTSCIIHVKTKGGQYRWLKTEVESLAKST